MKRTDYLARLFYYTFVSALLAAVLPAAGESQAPAQQPEQPLVVNLEDADWGEPGFAEGFPQGVQSARLGIDPENGGPTYFASFPAGSHFDLHWHTHAEYVVVVSGEVTIVLGEQSHALSPGSYIVIPAKMNHSWHVPGEDDSVILVRRRGPADFNFVGR